MINDTSILIKETIIKKIILFFIIVITVVGIYSTIGLYADGAFFLYSLLSQQEYFDFDKPRLFVQIVTQTPVILGIKFGLNDITTLTYLHSLGLVGIPMFFWFAALFAHLKSEYFWALLIAFSATYLTSGFFSIGEYNLTYSLVTLCFSILLKDKINNIYLLLLIISAFVLQRSYEAMVFLGPLLFFISALRLSIHGGIIKAQERISLYICLFLFSSATSVALWSINYPRDPANLANATGIISYITDRNFIFIVFMFLIFLISYLPIKKQTILTTMSIITSIYYIGNNADWITPYYNYKYRTISGLALFGILFFMTLLKYKIYKQKTIPTSLNKQSIIISLAIFIPLFVSSLNKTIEFSVWIKEFETQSLILDEWISIDETYLSDSNYHWLWTNPSLSIVLTGSINGGFNNQKDYKGWQPFNPEELSENPLIYFYKKNKLYRFE